MWQFVLFFMYLEVLLPVLPALFCHELSLVTEKALQIVYLNYNDNRATSIVWDENSHLEVTEFLMKFNKTVKTTSLKTLHYISINKINKVIFKQTVFFTVRAEEFENLMILLNPHIVVPIRLVLVLTTLTSDAELSKITKIAWENDLSNILIVNSKDGTNIELTTYYPYSERACGDHTPVNIGSKRNNDLFANKFSNFHTCPIRVSALPFSPYTRFAVINNTVQSVSGLDGYVFKTMATSINASINVVSWKERGGAGTFINGTATGSFADIVYNRADMILPAMVINHLRYPVAQISPVFQTADAYWLGPRRHEIQEWKKVFLPLIADITPAIIVSFVFFVIVTKIVIRCSLRKIYFRHSVAFQTFIIFIGQGAKIDSKSLLVNSLFAMWIWFCIIVRIAYQGELVNGLQKTVLEKPFSSLLEATRAVDGYGGPDTFREFYRGTKYFEGYQILNVSELRPQVKKVARDKKKFLIAIDKLLEHELNGRVQFLDEAITHAPVCFYMRPRWSASKKISAVVQRIAEAGFVKKALQDHINNCNKREKMRDKDRKTQPLRMKTLIGCFYGLGCLYFICFLVFIAEIVFSKLNQNWAWLA